MNESSVLTLLRKLIWKPVIEMERRYNKFNVELNHIHYLMISHFDACTFFLCLGSQFHLQFDFFIHFIIFENVEVFSRLKEIF